MTLGHDVVALEAVQTELCSAEVNVVTCSATFRVVAVGDTGFFGAFEISIPTQEERLEDVVSAGATGVAVPGLSDTGSETFAETDGLACAVFTGVISTAATCDGHLCTVSAGVVCDGCVVGNDDGVNKAVTGLVEEEQP